MGFGRSFAEEIKKALYQKQCDGFGMWCSKKKLTDCFTEDVFLAIFMKKLKVNYMVALLTFHSSDFFIVPGQ